MATSKNTCIPKVPVPVGTDTVLNLREKEKKGTDLLFIMPDGKYFLKGYACQEQNE